MKVKIIVLAAALFLLPGYLTPQVSIQTIISEIKADSLIRYVKELSGETPVNIEGSSCTITSRNKKHQGNDLAASFIKQKFTQFGLEAFDQKFSSTGRNVYAVKKGKTYPDQKYIICAHYDDMPSIGNAPGADDNASGTAAVIEAARIFSRYNFPYTAVFALWDEEEQGCTGSMYFARLAREAGDSILGVINLDMIAWESNDDNKVRVHTRNTGDSYKLSSKMIELNRIYSIGLSPVIKDPGLSLSDQASFWERDYGAILLIEDDDTDFNSFYHTASDRVQYFDIPFFEKCVKLASATLAFFLLDYDIAIQHTSVPAIGSSSDLTIDARITSRLAIGNGSKAPRLYYRIRTGSTFSAFFSSAGTDKGSGNFSFTIPAQPSGTLIQYYIAAQDASSQISKTLPDGGGGFDPPGSIPPANCLQFYIAQMNVVFSDSADNMSSWTASGSWNTTGRKYNSSPYSFTDSPDGQYAGGQTYTLTSVNSFTIPASYVASLRFKSQWDIESNFDYGQVQVSTDNGTTWTALSGLYTRPGTGYNQPIGQPVYDGFMNTWAEEDISLSAYAGKQIKIRFLLKTDGAINKDGWYIDDIILAAYTPVPVALTSFKADILRGDVILSWRTATEINNRGYQIQRSADNSSWQDIAFVPGHGTTSDPHSYSYRDSKRERGYFYYRIRQTDYNGNFTIYGPVTADLMHPDYFVLEQNYPNPFNPVTVIKYALPVESRVVISIYNSLGERIAKITDELKPAGFHEAQFNASGITSGIYFCVLDASCSDNKTGYHDIIKMMVLK